MLKQANGLRKQNLRTHGDAVHEDDPETLRKEKMSDDAAWLSGGSARISE